ncbi:MAG: hypothetical protein KJ063_12120 [Anaerolineae bacterium]|nr:hypothetical protein [Anaerolineae bacterium]
MNDKRSIFVIIGILFLGCLCLLVLAAAAFFLVYPQTQSTGTGEPPTSDITLSLTPETVADITSELTVAAETTSTPSPIPATDTATTAPATLPIFTSTPTELPPTATPTVKAPITATPGSEPSPTLLPTDTPSPTATAGTGIPAPRLANHTNCQNNISTFDRGSTIEFQWTWTQRVDTANGFYLEVRVGPRGATNLTSLGGLNNDVLSIPAQNLWVWRVPVSTFYQDTTNDYHWQVAYMNQSQRTVIASTRGCFNIR